MELKLTQDNKSNNYVNCEAVQPPIVNLDDTSLEDPVRQGGFLFKTLNDNTLGKHPGTIMLLGAPTGHGKTMYALREAIESVRTGNKRVVYYSTELPADDIMRRVYNIFGITDKEAKKTKREWLKDKFYIVDAPLQDTYVAWLSRSDVDEIYIDYLDTSMINAKDAADKSNQTNRIVRALIEFGKLYNKFTLVCAQAKYLEIGEYTTNSFRDCTAIANAATIVCLLHKRRPNVDMDINSDYVLDIAKLRDAYVYACSGTKVYFSYKSIGQSMKLVELGYANNGEKKEYGVYMEGGREHFTSLMPEAGF